MRIIEGENVDLISPYPIQELDRAVQWFFQYSSYTGDDSSPKTPENIRVILQDLVTNTPTYGIIDRNNVTKHNHEAPLVGIINFTPQSAWNGYMHIATSRAAWGRRSGVGLADEAAKLVLADTFSINPQLQRISALITAKNYPARRLAERVGMKIDGVMENFFVVGGKPIDGVHLGILRTKESIDDASISRPSDGGIGG